MNQAKSLRITVISGPFLSIPPAPCGAVERIWVDLAEEFARRGHNVTFIHKKHPEVTTRKTLAGVRLVPIRGHASRGRLALNLPLDFLYSARALTAAGSSDVIVTNTFWLPVLSRLIGHRKGMLHVHVARVPRGQTKLYHAVGAHRLAPESSYIADCQRAECPAAAPRIRVFNNPIRTDVFVPTAVRPKRARRVLAYAGRIHPEKGLELLLQALRALLEESPEAPIALRIVGPWRTEQGGGGAAWRRHLAQLAEGLPVRFHGPIFDRDRFARFLQSADGFIYPSLAEKGEACPVAPLEAMACGLPQILSDLGQFRDYYTPGEHGITFDHRGSAARGNLLAALREFLALSPEAITAMGERCAKRAREYSVAAVADRYLADFAGMTGE